MSGLDISHQSGEKSCLVVTDLLKLVVGIVSLVVVPHRVILLDCVAILIKLHSSVDEAWNAITGSELKCKNYSIILTFFITYANSSYFGGVRFDYF